MKPWALIAIGRGPDLPPLFHVKPIADSIEHRINAACWCKPTEAAENLLVHHSADGRETLDVSAAFLPATRH